MTRETCIDGTQFRGMTIARDRGHAPPDANPATMMGDAMNRRDMRIGKRAARIAASATEPADTAPATTISDPINGPDGVTPPESDNGPGLVDVAPATTIPAIVPPSPVDAAVARFGGVCPGVTVPAWFRPIVAGIMAVTGANATTMSNDALTAAFIDAANAIRPADKPTGSNGRWTNAGIRYAQNDIAFAFACAVPFIDARRAGNYGRAFMAAWRAELPNAKCDYFARMYGYSTLGEIVGSRHGSVDGVTNGLDVIRVWANPPRA